MTIPDTSPILILDNIRSCHNVGSILRTADGAGITRVFTIGITPYPRLHGDTRQEYVIERNTKQIHKTALGAEEAATIVHLDDCNGLIAQLRGDGYAIYALDNNCDNTQDIFSFQPVKKFALILGSETDGLSSEALSACDAVLEIPMRGTKSSLNVSVATGIALYQLLTVT